MSTGRFSSLSEGFEYIESFMNLERGTFSPRAYRLDRMRFLLALFGDPHRAFKSVHIAGSKGKGSTALYIASILAASGIKTGLYTSPHVVSYKERITCAGAEFPDGFLLSLIERIAQRIEEVPAERFPGDSLPTTFELLTVLGFLAFREAGCSWAVIETGIGGRLDATNTVEPEASVITPIELEHTEYLGSTLESIAHEKGGIIKHGVLVFLSRQTPEAIEVLSRIASERSATITRLADAVSYDYRLSIQGTGLELAFRDGFSVSATLPMLGAVQAENAALAATVARGLFPELDAETLSRGLSAARLPGRMELIPGTPPVLLDAAHTPASVKRLLESFRELYPRGGVLVFGSVLGKDPDRMADALAPEFDGIVISPPGQFKKSDPEAVYAVFRSRNERTVFEPVPERAFETALALSGGEPVLVTGSFYMIAEIRKMVLNGTAPVSRNGARQEDDHDESGTKVS